MRVEALDWRMNPFGRYESLYRNPPDFTVVNHTLRSSGNFIPKSQYQIDTLNDGNISFQWSGFPVRRKKLCQLDTVGECVLFCASAPPDTISVTFSGRYFPRLETFSPLKPTIATFIFSTPDTQQNFYRYTVYLSKTFYHMPAIK